MPAVQEVIIESSHDHSGGGPAGGPATVTRSHGHSRCRAVSRIIRAKEGHHHDGHWHSLPGPGARPGTRGKARARARRAGTATRVTRTMTPPADRRPGRPGVTGPQRPGPGHHHSAGDLWQSR